MIAVEAVLEAVLEGNKFVLLQGHTAGEVRDLEPQFLKILCLCYNFR